MSRIDILITPLTAKSPDEDVRACAAIINRRHQYEPNRLHDLTRPEEERLARKIRQLTRHLHEPRTCAYVAKINASGEVVGWISWRKPQFLVRVTPDTSNAMAQVPSKTCIKKPEDDRDYEVDHEAIELVNKEKKVKEAHFFGTDPFWCVPTPCPHSKAAALKACFAIIQGSLSFVLSASCSQSGNRKQACRTFLVGRASSGSASQNWVHKLAYGAYTVREARVQSRCMVRIHV